MMATSPCEERGDYGPVGVTPFDSPCGMTTLVEEFRVFMKGNSGERGVLVLDHRNITFC